MSDLGNENPYAGLYWDMIAQAKGLGASDIHIQPDRESVRIRFRVNGDLIAWKNIAQVHKAPFLQEAKRLSQCSVAVSLRAQDSRISVPELNLDVRVSLVPTIHGEKLVLRLLDKARSFDLAAMNLEEDAQRAVNRALKQGSGVCLITGPTGSGKTTLLYSALAALDRASLNIVTIEDPVEYTFPSITQIQVSPKLGYGDALRAMMRQDPDVILVGEVRDRETAELCFQAAATGHLVLSTLHANNAREVTGRLMGLGIREDQVTSLLRFASAQRLLAKLCPTCKRIVNDRERHEFFGGPEYGDGPLWTRGPHQGDCSGCQRGIVGRLPVFEYVEPTTGRKSPSLQEAMLKLGNSGEVDAYEILSAA
ncbi:ATPase, T2SS/T4P/T4SS family [Bdellovibrionota bacterium FG-1]